MVVEYYFNVAPCPLCLLQRGFYILLVLLTVIATVHDPKAVGRRIYASLIFIFCLLGGAVAWRQLWLQTQPHDPNAACLPGLAYMFKTMPVSKVLLLTYQGSAECANIDWRFLGLSMAGWSLIFFCAIAVLMVAQLFRFKRVDD